MPTGRSRSFPAVSYTHLDVYKRQVLDGDLDEFVEASLKSGLDAGAKRSDAA